ncbi:MAG: selenide, water dikinase SelD [Armatimonadetes bacterium]|nr:selenide, water dikinase SelD [Armatimonadota bacterium]
MTEVLRQIPPSQNPNLLVGLETRDDAGVFRVSDDLALVQTVDFFTPVVDDPYAFGQIAAANALSDVYAMGGKPMTVLNIACFDPTAAPADVWASVLRGAADKTYEAGATILGGHSVDDKEPKFGMAVTGTVDPRRMFANTEARPGDLIYLTKPLGTGIVTTAAKFDDCPASTLDEAIASMAMLNDRAAELGHAHEVRCATDITGFGLAGHLFNVARASSVAIEVFADRLPVFSGLPSLIEQGHLTGGSRRNREFLGSAFVVSDSVDPWRVEAILDAQTSGGLALFTAKEIEGMEPIGIVVEGSAEIRVV